MGRAPEKVGLGLRKGPWSPEEDKILISYVKKHGHSNWRALPKLAGLLRCGKSCRLRWINYLRPDIKRGNFTREEEETIIKLHEILGNRWSAIAARLPGRTDNEIKNVWHTHLKKKLKQNDDTKQQHVKPPPKCGRLNARKLSGSANSNIHPAAPPFETSSSAPMSPQPSSSDISSVMDTSIIVTEEIETNNTTTIYCDSESFPLIDENIWSELELMENNNSTMLANDFLDELQFPFTSNIMEEEGPTNIDDGMDFWYNLFVKAGGMEELL